MSETIQTVARVGSPVRINARRFDVYAWREGVKWCARLPELDGAEVSGCDSSAAARTKLSGKAGRIVSEFHAKHEEPKLNTAHGFVPPVGAIHRKFVIGAF